MNISRISGCIYNNRYKINKAEKINTANFFFCGEDFLKEDIFTYKPPIKDVPIILPQYLKQEIKKKSPKETELIYKALNSLEFDSTVSQKTIFDFVNEIINLKDFTTLKKAVESNVKFRIVLSEHPARYQEIPHKNKTEKFITFCENIEGKNNITSLAHELGHAFDYNTTLFDVYYLSENLIPVFKKIGGVPTLSGYKPNSTMYIPTYTDESGTLYKKEDIFQYNISLSKEFHLTYLRDCRNLLEIDKEKGLKQGSTFKSLISDFSDKSLTGYYLGCKEGSPKINMEYLHKEMFAQMAALYTNGKTSKPDFDKIAFEYFPNMYNFVEELFSLELF